MSSTESFGVIVRSAIKRRSAFKRFVRPIINQDGLLQWWKRSRPTPPPHQAKINAILYWADFIGATVLVETGTFRGDMVRAVCDRFSKVISVELMPHLALRVSAEFKSHPGDNILVGDSATVLPALATTLVEPTVFWLDAHFSAADTGGQGEVPVYAELEAATSCPAPHVILIDDAREFVGKEGYPTIADVEAYLRDKGYAVRVVNDAITALPKRLLV
jgi:hypothetical protein